MKIRPVVHRQHSQIALMRSNSIFGRLDEVVLQQLADSALYRHFCAKSVIMHQDDRSQGLYLVASGIVKISRYSHKGREHILTFMQRGDSFNEVAALDGRGNPATATAHTDTYIWCFSRQDLLRVANQHPSLAIALATSISIHVRQLIDKLDDLSTCSVKTRLARFLQEQSNGQDQIQLQMTHEEIASQLGTVREVVGRSLRKLEADGVIVARTGPTITIDLKQLVTQAEL